MPHCIIRRPKRTKPSHPAEWDVSTAIPAPPTKALSVRMPWAWLLVHPRPKLPDLPYKPVENRDMQTKVRGPIFIHAGATVDWEGLQWIRDNRLLKPAVMRELERVCEKWTHGALIGTVELTECTRNYQSAWFQGPWGYVMRKPHPFNRPIDCKGQVGFFSAVPEAPATVEKGATPDARRQTPEPAGKAGQQDTRKRLPAGRLPKGARGPLPAGGRAAPDAARKRTARKAKRRAARAGAKRVGPLPLTRAVKALERIAAALETLAKGSQR